MKNFFIKKDSTFPRLEIPLTDLSSKYDITDDMWENCAVTFSMYDIDNRVYRVANKEGELIVRERINPIIEPYNYFIGYTFTTKDTKYVGTFHAEFKIDFFDEYGNNCLKLTIPNEEMLYVIVEDSITKTTVM
jgi:hypothetical protein